MEKVSKYIIVLLVFIFAASSCSTVKVIPEGESRLVENEIEILNSKKYQTSSLQPYIKQKPNSYFFLGWNPVLNLYHWSN